MLSSANKCKKIKCLLLLNYRKGVYLSTATCSSLTLCSRLNLIDKQRKINGLPGLDALILTASPNVKQHLTIDVFPFLSDLFLDLSKLGRQPKYVLKWLRQWKKVYHHHVSDLAQRIPTIISFICFQNTIENCNKAAPFGKSGKSQNIFPLLTLLSTWLERSFFISSSLFSANKASLFSTIASLFFSSSAKVSMASFLLSTFSTSLSSHWRRWSNFACSSLENKRWRD